jgi:ubiquinone/menaquinone biosynthesis C-methylase UbiE
VTWATDYFESTGTVANWWDPLNEDDPHFREWMIAQQTELLAVTGPSGRTVLDAGCGRGRVAIQAALMGASVTAVDVSAEMLAIAEETARSVGARVDFQLADLHHLPFADATFDLVFHLEILLHLEDPQRVLAEIGRVLKPHGMLVLTTNGQNPLARLLHPATQGSHAASRFRLFAATAVNEVMTSLFGFTWRRTRITAASYKRFFNAPVRPTYNGQVREMLRQAGFVAVYHRSLPRHFPRQHHWIALQQSS